MSKMRNIMSIAFVALFAVIGVKADFAAHAAAANTVYFTPSGGTYTVGQVVTVGVREDSGSTGVFSAQASFSYPKTLLQYNSTSTSGSAFPIDPQQSTGGSGHVLIVLGSKAAVTSDELIANVSFTVIAAGTATLTPDAVCTGSNYTNCNTVLDTNNANAITAATPASFTLHAGATPTPTPSPTPTPINPTPAPKTPGSVSITPNKSVTPISVPDNTQVQVSVPASIQPSTVQSDGVQEIQYYLNGKLVYTATTAPYTYHLDTTGLLNGKYTLKSVTTYDNGRTGTSTQDLVVANPFSLTQFKLQAEHYAKITIPIFLILVVILLIWLTRNTWKRRSAQAGYATTAPMAPTGTPPSPEVFSPMTGIPPQPVAPPAAPVATTQAPVEPPAPPQDGTGV